MTRELSKNRGRAREILAAEIFGVVKARLEKSGFEVANPENPQKIGLHGQFFANMSCVPHGSGVALSVRVTETHHPITGVATFSKMFSLSNTESPRRVAVLIVKFLRKAIVKLVHQA